MPNQNNSDRRLLWVFEGDVHSPEWYLKYIDEGMSLHDTIIDVLWLSDCEYADICDGLVNQGYQINLIMAGPLLQKEVANFAGELEIWSRAFFQHSIYGLDLWSSCLTEYNFSHSLWFDLIRLNVFITVLQSGTYQACRIFARGEFAALCGQICNQHRTKFQGISQFSQELRLLFKEIYRWFTNLGSELIAQVILSRHTGCKHSMAQLAYTQYPQNWVNVGKQISNRFVGRWSAKSCVAPGSKGYLVALLRSDQARLQSASQILARLADIQNSTLNLGYDIVERYGDLKTIIKTYFDFGSALRWLVRWRKVLKSTTLYWRGASLDEYLWGMGISAAIVDIPKNRYLSNCVEMALRVMGGETLVVPIFELVEGRSVVRGGKRAGAKVVGMQHGAIGLAHGWRVVLPQGLMKRYGGEAYQPDIYAVEGEVAYGWMLEAGIDAEKVKVIGASRVTDVIPRVELESQSKVLLVLGEYHRPRVLFDWCARHLLNSGYEVVLRPHPAHYKQARVWLDEQENTVRERIRMSELGESLSEDLLRLKPLCVLASVTGAMVEVALSGWPVGVILSNWLPDYAPLTAVEGKEVFSSNDPGEVGRWIEHLQSDRAYRMAYSQQCRQAARMHIAMIGTQAATALAEIC